MKVKDILRIKGSALYTVQVDQLVTDAVESMVHHDIGSVVVVEKGRIVGLLTFREILQVLASGAGSVPEKLSVADVMQNTPLTCSLETSLDEVRQIMLAKHARYLPVLEGDVLMGVISFYDVAKAVVDSQNLENSLLKAYIRDWPDERQ